MGHATKKTGLSHYPETTSTTNSDHGGESNLVHRNKTKIFTLAASTLGTIITLLYHLLTHPRRVSPPPPTTMPPVRTPTPDNNSDFDWTKHVAYAIACGIGFVALVWAIPRWIDSYSRLQRVWNEMEIFRSSNALPPGSGLPSPVTAQRRSWSCIRFLSYVGGWSRRLLTATLVTLGIRQAPPSQEDIHMENRVGGSRTTRQPGEAAVASGSQGRPGHTPGARESTSSIVVATASNSDSVVQRWHLHRPNNSQGLSDPTVEEFENTLERVAEVAEIVTD